VSVLSLNQPIPYIDTVKALAGRNHPVFLIGCDDGSHLVIKKENTSQGGALGLRHNLSVMRAVSPAAAGKLLTPQELAVLKDFAEHSKAMKALLRWAPEPEDVGIFRDYIASATPGTWFKMNKVNGIVGLDAAIKGLQQPTRDKTGVRAFAAALNAPGGFERLGQIAAADLYNGNCDRFDPDPEMPGDFNPLATDGSRFKTIVNLANVLVGLDGRKRAPVGLDSFNPFAADNDITTPTGQDWTGSYLAPAAKDKRKRFAQEIFDDLVVALGPRDRKLSFLSKDRLKANGPDRILAGMEQAILLLRQRVTHKADKPNAPAGLAGRKAVFG
jgi:hypothetical protein